MGAKPTLEEQLIELKAALGNKSKAEIVHLCRGLYESALEDKIREEVNNEPVAPELRASRPDESAAPIDVQEIESEPSPIEEDLVESISDVLEEQEPNSPKEPIPPKAEMSMNNRRSDGILIDFNDRWAFVNKLFDRNQDDFNRVVSQLNTMSTFLEARNFIDHVVKPDYNWADQEEFEQRFLDLVERHFH